MNKEEIKNLGGVLLIFVLFYLYGGFGMVLGLIGVLLVIALFGGIVVFLPIGGMRK